ncbi:M-like protein [Deinococcus navajonensis]|uniref:M-like protein n=1 Tax=Deinococcus navajonensis TaxID=309884 RepID=A0ABV8XMB5_9DEIO
MTHDNQRATSSPGDEVSNVDLQFMGRADVRREMGAGEEAEARLPDEFEDRGLDAQDIASNGSMITSDPASTHMPPDDATANEH